MARIFIIDDDASAELLAQNLIFRGHDAQRIRSVHEAMDRITDLAGCDLIILDLVMPSDRVLGSPVEGPRSSGMLVYKTLRGASTTVPILVFSANQDSAVIDIVDSDEAARYVPKWSSPSLHDFVEQVNSMLGTGTTRSGATSFIVHGHDEVAKLSLKNYLQNTLGFPEPLILHEQPNQGRTVIEKFEDLAAQADLVFVLLTPDDPPSSGDESDAQKRRARQNVIFELGYFLGTLGRRSGRVFLLHKGRLELPSDIAGIVYIDITNGIQSAGEEIRREIETACDRRRM